MVDPGIYATSVSQTHFSLNFHHTKPEQVDCEHEIEKLIQNIISSATKLTSENFQLIQQLVQVLRHDDDPYHNDCQG